jgi:acyl phosphate:glycerol-3-phosphate acyltransferase
MNPWLLTIPTAYLLGSIPFGYLLVRFFRKEDIRAIGSGNIGATNVARSGAKGLGILTLALDCLKAFAAVMLAKHLAPGDLDLAVIAAVAAILGHVFPVWLSFRGGKGVACALGVFLALSWPTAIATLLLFLIIAFATRYVSLASVVGAAALPAIAMIFIPYRSPVFIAGIIFIPLLVILKHSANIARLKNGTESKFGSKKSSLDANKESGHA